MVFQKLIEHKLYAKLSKCEFWLKQVPFLGYIISEGGISVDPSKIKDVLSWDTPKSVSNIHGFFGLVGYYRKLIEGFPKIIKPITELLGIDKKFKWSAKYKASFQELKTRLTTTLVLVMPDMEKSFSI
jgi:hypothetical protein